VNGARDLQPRQRGIGLIEIMVAMVIGMVMVLVIYQFYGVTEGQKRTITSGSDAQGNAAYGLFLLERDLAMSGAGVASAVASAAKMGAAIDDCDVPALRSNPVLIEAGASANDPDRLTVFYGAASSLSSHVAFVNNATVSSGSANDYQVMGPVAFSAGDLVLAVQGTKCTLSKVTAVAVGPSTGIATISHTPVAGWSSTLPITYQSILGALVNVGPENRAARVVYSVDTANHTLTSQARMPVAGAAAVLVGDVVNMKAQFGLDTDLDGTVDTWQEATGAWAIAQQSALRWDMLKRIRAVRVAIVTRSPLYEREAVTTTPLAMFNGTVSMGVAGDDQHYRYSVLETVVPLRNVVWNDK
jgi:type IV pilus assembly protein PilW